MPRHLHVDAVDRRAVDLEGTSTRPISFPADQLKSLRVFRSASVPSWAIRPHLGKLRDLA